MDCREACAALYQFFDNELEDGLQTPFKDHVSHCPYCARRLDFTRRILLIVREKTVRWSAPESLRLKILTSLPHRRPASGPH
jgi:mycothiol system anti-sigma-R factor